MMTSIHVAAPHKTGALIVSGGKRRAQRMSWGWWSSLLGQHGLLCVRLTTWTMLWRWSRGLWKDVRNALSMPQVCSIHKLSYVSHEMFANQWLISCLFKLDLISEMDLEVIANLTGCSPRHHVPSCKTTPNLDRFRTASSVCNNRWGSQWMETFDFISKINATSIGVDNCTANFNWEWVKHLISTN